MRLRVFSFFTLITALISVLFSFDWVYAQVPALPTPNVLLIYDKTAVTLVNISPTPLLLAGVSFWRAGGGVKLGISGLVPTLGPKQCLQLWASGARAIPVPSECTQRVRFLTVRENFWVAGYEGEPFRPQLNASALKICTASSGAVLRCEFHIPQGEDARKPWVVLDPLTGQPLPAGMQVAYDNDQMWIGNFTPGTVLPTRGDLRILYFPPDQRTPRLWTPGGGKWDGPWDNRGLQAGECIVLYADAATIKPLLPCTPVGRAVVPEQPWRLRFQVMGMREEHPSECGDGKPITGPVLCLVGG